MSITKPVYFTTPDGVERELRFALAAHKRLVEHLGMTWNEAVAKFGDGILPDLVYCLMFDRKENPPQGLDLSDFREDTYLESANELMAVFLQAASRGRAEKKDLLEVIQRGDQMEMKKLIGSIFGRSPDNVSDLLTKNSGGSQNGSSSPSATDTTNSEPSTTIAQD